MITETNVTVAIPTYNRSHLLKISLKSALEQDYPDFRVVVLDNASTDDTEAVVRLLADSRVTYIRNKSNVGLLSNLNRAIEINASPYLTILQDDDVILPGFIRQSVLALEKRSSAAFSFTRARAIDVDGAPLSVNAKNLSDPIPKGFIDGREFLHRIVAGHKWIIHFSSVMMRSGALAISGTFDSPHSKDTTEVNLYYRLAARFDLVSISEELCQVRYHPSRESQRHYNSKMGTGPPAVLAERIDAIAYLMQSDRAAEPAYRRWLAERLLDLNTRRSQETHLLVPAFSLTWNEQLQIARQELERLIPPTDSFILVDQNQWGGDGVAGCRVIPFLERDGQYWGPPPDDAVAIRELERLRRSGANFVVFGWPAFWWLDYFSGLRDYLYSEFRCVLKNSRLVAFDLRPDSDRTVRAGSH